MSLFMWCSKRVGGLSMFALIALSYWVITQESTLQRHGYKFEHPETMTASYSSTSTSGAGLWTYIFVYYCILVHVTIFIFPVRACWAVWDLTQTLSRTTRNSLKDIKTQSTHRRGSYASVSSGETLITDTNGTSSTAASSEAGDIDMGMYTDGDLPKTEPVVHAIVIPNYKEEVDTLKETLEVLASHPQAHSTYDVSSTSPLTGRVMPFQRPIPRCDRRGIAWPLPSSR